VAKKNSATHLASVSPIKHRHSATDSSTRQIRISNQTDLRRAKNAACQAAAATNQTLKFMSRVPREGLGLNTSFFWRRENHHEHLVDKVSRFFYIFLSIDGAIDPSADQQG